MVGKIPSLLISHCFQVLYLSICEEEYGNKEFLLCKKKNYFLPLSLSVIISIPSLFGEASFSLFIPSVWLRAYYVPNTAPSMGYGSE